VKTENELKCHEKGFDSLFPKILVMTAKKKKMDETMIKPLANSARFDKHPH
jgi:hypothetical protein